MEPQDYVLAALSAGGDQASFSPVQLQKLFFLSDREIPALVGGPYFEFRPYDFGPFDKEVYGVLEQLARAGLVVKTGDGSYRMYSLTPEGMTRGRELLAEMHRSAREYLSQITNWVRSLTFSQLVSAIYRSYPEMKANSIFQQ